MLIIAKNTEEALLQALKSCWEMSPTHRCLHLKFSQIEQDIDSFFEDVQQYLRDVLDDKSVQIYICKDQDVFILTRVMTAKRVQEFLARLSTKLEPASLGGLATLFEIGVDWPKLRQICTKKIENIEFENAKKSQVPALEFQCRREDAFKVLDPDLINSVSLRRAEREVAEIMVVEDDPFSQKLVSNALKNKYVHSVTADGQGAIMNYVKKAPDVLFLDIGLPDIDGHQVLEKLFQLDPDAYVVMFSGNGDRENILKAVELGAKGFIGKPFTQDKLFQYISKSPFIQEKQNKENFHGNIIR